MTFDPTFISNFLLVLTGFSGAFLVALWISMVVWTYRDIRARGRDKLVHILAVLLVGLLNLPGVLVYLILRPPRTLEEEYQLTLEEEALLQALDELPLCPGCERRVRDEWQVCPNCHTKLKKACHHCSKLMELPWNICPYCGTPAPGMRREGMDFDEALRGLGIDNSERIEAETLKESSLGDEIMKNEAVEESDLDDEAINDETPGGLGKGDETKNIDE